MTGIEDFVGAGVGAGVGIEDFVGAGVGTGVGIEDFVGSGAVVAIGAGAGGPESAALAGENWTMERERTRPAATYIFIPKR